MASCYYTSKIILRVCQAVLALIAFAASAYIQSQGLGDAKINFMVFVGVTGWLLSMFYAVVSCMEGLQRIFWGIVEVAINSLWVLFWMAAAAAYAAFPPCKLDQAFRADAFTQCDAFLTSEAFAWMGWLLWIPSLAISIVDLKRGEGITGSGGAPARY